MQVAAHSSHWHHEIASKNQNVDFDDASTHSNATTTCNISNESSWWAWSFDATFSCNDQIFMDLRDDCWILLILSHISPKMHQNGLVQHEFPIQWIKLGARWQPLSSLFYWHPFCIWWPLFSQDSGKKCENLAILARGVVHQISGFYPLDQPSWAFSTKFSLLQSASMLDVCARQVWLGSVRSWVFKYRETVIFRVTLFYIWM